MQLGYPPHPQAWLGHIGNTQCIVGIPAAWATKPSDYRLISTIHQSHKQGCGAGDRQGSFQHLGSGSFMPSLLASSQPPQPLPLSLLVFFHLSLPIPFPCAPVVLVCQRSTGCSQTNPAYSFTVLRHQDRNTPGLEWTALGS